MDYDYAPASSRTSNQSGARGLLGIPSYYGKVRVLRHATDLRNSVQSSRDLQHVLHLQGRRRVLDGLALAFDK